MRWQNAAERVTSQCWHEAPDGFRRKFLSSERHDWDTRTRASLPGSAIMISTHGPRPGYMQGSYASMRGGPSPLGSSAFGVF